ncbi:hypothetical protein [Rhizobium leguminosarum]|uniref:hypothetical protein n=1 Tax=Rhizobium leguminosarum TaxID=384 RepID=UPI003F9CF259
MALALRSPHEASERVDLLLSHARVGAQLGERSLQRGLRVFELALIGEAMGRLQTK